MTHYRVDVVGPEAYAATADDIALMLTSDDHFRTSEYIITVMRSLFDEFYDEDGA